MNEQAILDLYNLAKSNGYSKSIEEFKNLLKTNENALNDMYDISIQNGYKKGIDDFKILVGATQQPVAQQPVKQTTQPVMQLPLKKKEGSTLPSGIGTLESSGIKLTNVRKALGQEEEQQPIMMQRVRPETTAEADETWRRKPKFDFMPDFNKPAEEDRNLVERPAELGFIGRYTPERDKEKTPQFVEEALGALTLDTFTKKSADSSKKELEYYLKDMGFKIEESAGSSYYTGRYVDVVSPRGERYPLYLGNDLMRKETYGFAGLASEEDIEGLKNFVRVETFSDPGIAKKQYLYEKENQKFKTKENIDTEVSKLSQDAEALKNEMNNFMANRVSIQEMVNKIEAYPENLKGSEQYNSLVEEYNKMLEDDKKASAELENKRQSIIANDTALKAAAGNYVKFREGQGSFQGAMWNKAMGGAGKTLSGLYDLQIEAALNYSLPGLIANYVGGEDWDNLLKTIKYGEYDDTKVLPFNPKESLRGIFTKLLGDTNVTEEYVSKIEREGNIVQRGILGLAESTPAMLGGPLSPVLMGAMVTDALDQEMMNDPDLKDLSELEKMMVKAPIGIVSGILEKVGLKGALKGTALVKTLTGRAISKLPINATAAELRNATLNEIKNMGIKSSVALVGSALSEAETGLLQQGAEYGIKDIYNLAKGKKMFDTPEFFSQKYFNDLIDAALTEAVGGVVIGVPNSIAAAFKKDGFRGLDDETFKIFEQLAKDNDSRKFFVTDLKNKINSGQITGAQGKEIINAYDQAAGMIGTVDDEITDVESRKIAMDLISERKKLEAKRDKMDPGLAKPIQKRIDQINEQLSQITQDAIQKQAAGEVSLQPEAGAGQEVEIGGPEAKPKITPEESKRKEDLVAALEATDKDVIAIGDELLDRKEAKAELEAITQKEQAAVTEQGGIEQAEGLGTQLEMAAKEEVTPAEVTPVEVTPAEVVEKTPEQEADLLEELMTGKKKEPVAVEPAVEAVVEENATPEEEAKPEIPKAEEVAEADIEIKDIEATPEEAQKQVEEFDEEALPEQEKPKAGQVAELSIDEINADPERFQYKEVTDKEAGVTEKFKGEKAPFKKELAGVISVWVDPADGKTYVINGHHRLDFAKRSGEKTMNVIYIDAKNASEARLKGAMQNIAEGMGTDMDAAKVFRETGMTVEQVQASGISVKGAKAMNGLALASLSDNLFNLVVQGKLSQTVGIIIGNTIKNKTVQEQFYNVIKGKNLNNGTIKVMAEDIQAAPTENVEQMDLFGVTATEQASYQQRASFIAGIRAIVSKAKNILGKAAKSKGFLEEYGNDIDEIASETGSRESAMALAVFDRLRNTSPEIRALIDKGVERIKNGENKNKVLNETAKQIIEATPRILEGVTGQPVAGRGEVKESSAKGKQGATGKSLADAVRKNLKIKGPDGLQSNILGIPIAIWNAGVETVAKSIEVGMAVNDAIKRGINYIKEKHGKKINEVSVERKMLIGLYSGAIETAREAGITEEGLKTYLTRKGVTEEQIETLLKYKKRGDKKPISKEKITGKPKPKKVTVNDMTALKDQIKLEVKAAREGAKSVSDAVKAIVEYFNSIKDRGNLTRKDLIKILGIVSKVNSQKTLDNAANKIFEIIGKAKTDIIEVSDLKALKDQIRLEARAAREAKGDLNAKRKMLTAAIKEMEKKGSISARQAKALINRVNAVNLDNPVMVDRLLDYADKVFNDAAYAEKLSQANKLQSQIKQLSKNKDKFGNLTAFAAEFAKIDPALVENIDKYIEMASKVKEGVQGSKTVNGKVIPADMVDVGKAMEYVNKTMKAQEETIRLKTAERLQELIGVDVSDLSMAKLQELMELVKAEALATGDQKKDLSDKINDIFGTNKDKEKAIRDGIQRMFDTYSTIIKDMFETGVDPFSDPDNPTTVEFKESDKKIVEEFMAMDLSLLDKKEALRAADALNNFLTNKSTAGMSAMLGEYDGRKNSKEVNEKGIRAKPIKMYWVPILGRSFYEQFASIPLFFEKLFKGVTRGNYVREKMGINSLINHKAEALTLANRIINNYVLEFTKKKPNNKKFQDIYNIIERGIIGDLAKTIVGDAKQVAEEFNRRKKLIEETIQILEKGGTKKETKEAKVIKEVYDKIAKDSKTIEEVKAKADQTNVAAVQFWVDQWAKLYDQFADVALNVYNRVLDKSVNYVPDRFGFLERAEKVTKDADGFESMFFANSNSEYFYKKEAGSLMKSQPPKSLFKDGKSDMYVNLSFDTNNANALLEALIDIKTARDIRQIQAFKNDPNFEEIVPNGNDAKVLKERISTLIRNIRNKRIITDKTFRQLTRNLDRFASFGAALALAGPTQAIKQTIPVAVNTLFNAGSLNLSVINNKDVNNFINNSGMAIANRGLDATTELETLNQKLEQTADTKAGDLVRAVENINKKLLKAFLSNFDVFIARASWITYYEKSLRKQGVKGKIDYSTHKINQQAADYAQTMVDRQQNISDKDLAGKMYESGNPWKQFIVKVFLPLATFRMNQTTRMMNDVTVITSKTSSLEDKKIALRSFAGYAAEMATFRAIGIGISYGLLYSIAQFIRGEDEDEEEKQKKFNNLIKGAATSVVSDVFSPMPQADMPVKYLFSSVLDQIQSIGDIKEEDRLNIFTENKESLSTAYGMFGIGLDKFNKLWEDIELGVTGKFKDDYGREKTIREKDRELLSNPLYVAIHLTSDFGISPFGPETNNVMNNITRMIKKDAMTEKQLEEYKETGEYPTKKSEAAKEEDKASKTEAYGGYKTLKEFEEKDPIKYDEYSAKGGKLYKYREDERKKDEEKNKDKPFRGLSEEKFKELYPEEWRKYYGPGTAYFKRQNSPAMLQKKAQEEIRKAQLEQKRKIADAKRKQQEALKKALGK